MSDIQEKSRSQLHALTLLGPASVVLSVLLLVINDSPFYIDFSACAMLGLVISWRFKLKGLAVSATLLLSLLFYEHFFHPEPVTLWDVGLSLSVLMSFLVTSLASLEFWEHLRSFGSVAASEIQSWEAKVEESLSGKRALERAVRDLEEKLTGSANELAKQTALAAATLSTLSEREEQIKHLTGELEKLTDRLKGLESEKEEIGKALGEALALKTALKEKLSLQEEQMGAKLHAISEHEEKIKHLTGELENLKGLESEKMALKEKLSLQEEQMAAKLHAISEHEEKIKHLTGELEKLTDRLKGLESEKEEIEKALEEALAPKSEYQSKDFAKMQGLYRQLRSQFEEKSLTLDQTRRELFQAKESLLALDISSQETDIDHHHLWSGHVKELSVQIGALELEIALLEELVFKDRHSI
jgi:chromosome segregation ATPase